MTAPERRTLAQVAAEWGEAVPCAGNLPVDIGDPDFAWFVESGAVDLFLVERRDGHDQSAPRHMLRAESGRLLPGTAPHEETTVLGVIAKGLPGTTLRRVPASRLAAVRRAELAEQVDAWIAELSAMLVRDVAHQPKRDALLGAGDAPAVGRGTLGARRGVVWVTGLEPGAGLFMSLADPSGAGGYIPLAPATWLALRRDLRIATTSSGELAERRELLAAVEGFNRVALSVERLNRLLAVADQANLARERVVHRSGEEEDARRRLFDLYDTLGETGDSALHDALKAIGRHAGIAFRRPPPREGMSAAAALAAALSASGVPARRVRLERGDRWWTGDCGAMLAHHVEDGRPVALLPGGLGNYRAVDPARGRKWRVTAANAAKLRPEAWLFYPPLKSPGARWRDLWSVARTGLAADLARYLATGVLGGLVMLLPAVALGVVAEEAIPLGDAGLLYGVSATLAAFAIGYAALRVVQGTALARIEGRAISRVEASFWDRLVRLPARVMRRYPANDLAARGAAFRSLRGVIGDGLLSVVFLSPAILVIASRNFALGALTAALGTLSLLVTVALGLRRIPPRARELRAVRRLSGRLFQLIGGVSKLRVEGAEGLGFAAWARDYREQKRAELAVGAVDAHRRAFGAALPLLAGAVLILALTLLGPASVGVADLLAVFALFLLFQTALVRLGRSLGDLAEVAPALNEVRPLLAEAPEASADLEAVETLGGDIVFDRVSFSYDPDGPPTLDDVSIRARAGEFVAIAGESGAGKSTLFRLALALERPTKGSIYYDGRDLRHLDPKDVRRQIGVVPQTARLHPQDLWDNIVGDHDGATAAAAWQAARMAAVDREIAAMPMGMLTPVGAGAAVTSGGESQRIRTARALIRNPRILLLDEATNWLDNKTQAKVMANLAELTSTRIVIAHRLSTLRQADRIYVLKEGRVVREGTFAELAEVPGPFRDLVRRQMA